MLSKLFIGLVLLALIALGVSMMAGLNYMGKLIFKKTERAKHLESLVKMGAVALVSYAFLSGLRFDMTRPGMWTNVYPNDINADINLSTRYKTLNVSDVVSHDDINDLVRKETIWPSTVTIEATNTQGKTRKEAYLYTQYLKERVHGDKPSTKTRGHITRVRYGKGTSNITWYGLTVESGDIPLLDLVVEYEPSTGTSPNTLFETK